MDKKPAFIACYFSIDPEITQAQLKAKKELPECDFSAISAVKQRMDKNGICYIVQKERTDEKTDQEQMTLKEVEYPEKLLSVSSSPYIVYYQ